MTDIGENLIAEIISSILFLFLGVTITLIAIKFRPFRKLLRKLGINVPIPKPQLDLDLTYNHKTDSTAIAIKNAGDQAAFNVYCFLFEVFHASENLDYRISSLGEENIKAGILAPGERITFKGSHLHFDGCNITAEQEVWIEYTDELDTHYRTRVIPPSPRGDSLKVETPTVIKHRIPRLPRLAYTGQKDYEMIRRGKKGLPNLLYT